MNQFKSFNFCLLQAEVNDEFWSIIFDFCTKNVLQFILEVQGVPYKNGICTILSSFLPNFVLFFIISYQYYIFTTLYYRFLPFITIYCHFLPFLVDVLEEKPTRIYLEIDLT